MMETDSRCAADSERKACSVQDQQNGLSDDDSMQEHVIPKSCSYSSNETSVSDDVDCIPDKQQTSCSSNSDCTNGSVADGFQLKLQRHQKHVDEISQSNLEHGGIAEKCTVNTDNFCENGKDGKVSGNCASNVSKIVPCDAETADKMDCDNDKQQLHGHEQNCVENNGADYSVKNGNDKHPNSRETNGGNNTDKYDAEPQKSGSVETSLLHSGDGNGNGTSRDSDNDQPVDYSLAKPTIVNKPITQMPAMKPKPLPPTTSQPDKPVPRPVDTFRPLGRLLHDLGLELVREQVYCDLIEIQTAKDSKNKLEEREKGQLVKLIEARQKLAARNAPYSIPIRRCSHCSYLSSSVNVLALHRQYGTLSRVDANMYVCCACGPTDNFRTRNTAQFITHMTTVHGLTAHLLKKPATYMCGSCQFEHKSAMRLEAHLARCTKKFSLNTNLQPLPGDCDIPLVYRPTDRSRTGNMMPPTGYVHSAAGTGQSVRTMLNTLRGMPSTVSGGMSRAPLAAMHSSIICEICGKLVDGREALWNHFKTAHHVELNRATMNNHEPWMKCDVCTGRFWTYQGLSRHLLLAHNRTIAAGYSGASSTAVVPNPRCHICGGNQTANPLSHFSSYHNITLLEMYHSKMCCMCNRKLHSGRSFEEHMVDQHSDIFANYDVLRTVLQALTTARYFKADDARLPMMRSAQQLSALSGPSTAGAAGTSLRHTSNVTASGSQQPPGNHGSQQTPSSTHKSQAPAPCGIPQNSSSSAQHKPQHFPPQGTPSQQKSQHAALQNTSRVPEQSSTDQQAGVDPSSNTAAVSTRHRKKRDRSSTSSAATPTKTSTGATAEQVKKLYEDLADIGRPILRSMRHKLGSAAADSDATGGTPSVNISGLANDVNLEKASTVDTEQSAAKRPRLDTAAAGIDGDSHDNDDVC